MMSGIRKPVALCLFGGVLILLAYKARVADGCRFAIKDVCQNVTCPNGQNCSGHTDYSCPNKFGDICLPPIAICGEYINPCAFTSCLTGTECTAVLDSCTNGICKVKGSCNEINRPGTCPQPPTNPLADCANSCQTDALCEEGAKCCDTPGGLGSTRKICIKAVQSY